MRSENSRKSDSAHTHAGHSHGPIPGTPIDKTLKTKLLIVFIITALIVAAQAIGAYLTGSLALITDTVHAVTDSIGLLVALIAAFLMHRPADSNRTWGFRRIEVVAAFFQATLLIGIGIYALVEGIRRLIEPPNVPGLELLFFGVIGLAANILGLIILSSSRKANFNMRAAFLEVLNDALGSVGVIVAAIVITTTGFMRADAIASLLIVTLIVPRAYRLLRETLSVLMEFAPKGLDLDQVRKHILQLKHVVDVHDLHASTVATGLPTITAHVVVSDECFHDGHAQGILKEVRECVRSHFEVAIEHSTFQIETLEFSRHESSSQQHP